MNKGLLGVVLWLLLGASQTAFALWSITPVTGSTPQQAYPRQPFANPIAAEVRDESGNPVAGAQLWFFISGQPGSNTGARFSDDTVQVFVTTNAQGLASAGFVTAGPLLGEIFVTVGTNTSAYTWPGPIRLTITAPPAIPGQKRWTGAGGSPYAWSQAENWAEFIAPAAGDLLIFPEGGPYFSTNDLSLQFAGVQVSSNSGHNFNGNPLVLTGDTPIRIESPAGSSVLFQSEVRILSQAATIVSRNPAGGTAGPQTFFRTRVHTVGGSLRVDAPQQYLELGGGVEASAGTALSFTGEVRLFDSVLKGPIRADGALLFLDGPNVLGPLTPGVVVNSGSLWISGTIAALPAVISTPLDLRAAPGAHPSLILTTMTTESTRLTGPIAITGTQTIYYSLGALAIESPISGTGRLVLRGHIPITFGNPANSFSGGLRVQWDTTVNVTTPEVIPDAGDVELVNGAILSLRNTRETVRGFNCSFDSTLELALGTVLTITGSPTILQNCTLRLVTPAGYAIPASGEIVLLRNQAGNVWTGTFRGLAEGTAVVVNGTTMTLTYRGGAGSDISLLAPAVLAATPASIAVNVNEAFDFSVTVKSPSGTPYPGAQVSFEIALPGGGPTSMTASATTDASGRAVGHGVADPFARSYTILARRGSQTLSIPVSQLRGESPPPAPPAVGNYQDMWWAGPAENGWGVSIVQHGEKLFAVVYGYDASANPMWLVLPSGGWDPARTTFSGALYAPRGTPFDAYDTSRLIVGSSVGPAFLTFFDADHAALDISVNGVHVRKNISRNRFGPVAATSGPSYGDMWWGGTSQNGWGVALLQQYRTIFGVWYTYGADGFTTWFVMPSGTWTSANTYEGKLYRTRGPTWLGADYDPAKLQVIEVGTFKLTFTGEAATMAYSVDGKAGTLNLSRLLF